MINRITVDALRAPRNVLPSHETKLIDVGTRGMNAVNILAGEPGRTYVIEGIDSSDADMDAFLTRLGAYPGEQITLVSKKRRACIVVVKNSRYSLDANLAQAVLVRESS